MPDDELENYDAQCKNETYFNDKQLFGKDFKLACDCLENEVHYLNFEKKCPECKLNYNRDENVSDKGDDNVNENANEIDNDNGNDNEFTTLINSKFKTSCSEMYAGCNIHFKYLEAIDKDAFYEKKDQGDDDVIYVKYIKK